MKTLMICIQEREKMSEHYKAFFQREINRGTVKILEYQCEENWDDNLLKQICADMEKSMVGCQEWKLLLADDRRGEKLKNKLLELGSFRKKFIQHLDGYFDQKECRVTLPVNAFIVAYLDEKDVSCIKDVDKAVDAELVYAGSGFGGRTRTLIYFGEQHKELPHECRRIIYHLLLLYYILYDIPIDRCSSYEICSLTAEWDWNGFHRFLEQMKKQYREMEIKCNESYVDTQSFKIPVVYADRYSSLRVALESEYKGATWESRIRKVKKAAVEKHKKLLKTAEKNFKRLKHIYYRYDHREWNSEEFQKQIEPYEAELNKLFAEGTDNYEEIMDRIEKLNQRVQDLNNHGSFAWILANATLVLCLLSSMYELPHDCFIIAGIMTFLFLLISESRVLPLGMKAIVQNELDEIDKIIIVDADRINREFELMVKYRDGYHRYYEWMDNQENQQVINHSVLKNLYQINERKRWLEELRSIAQRNQVKRYETRCRAELINIEEGLYYPFNWKREDVLRTPEGKTVPFPYPFIWVIKINKIKPEGINVGKTPFEE